MNKTEKLNISVLVAARDEYTHRLKNSLSSLVTDGLASLYEEAVKEEDKLETYEYIKRFQIYLKDIPKWNQSVLVEETKRILDKFPILQKLITAILVSNVKILSSIRLGGSNRDISIKIPQSDIFLHSIYIQAAQMIFYNQNIIKLFTNYHDYSDYESYLKIKENIAVIIDDIINSFVPIQNILEEYLSNVFDNEIRDPPDQPDQPDGLEQDEPESFDDANFRELTSDDMGLDNNNENMDNNLDNITSADTNAPTITINEFGSSKSSDASSNNDDLLSDMIGDNNPIFPENNTNLTTDNNSDSLFSNNDADLTDIFSSENKNLNSTSNTDVFETTNNFPETKETSPPVNSAPVSSPIGVIDPNNINFEPGETLFEAKSATEDNISFA